MRERAVCSCVLRACHLPALRPCAAAGCVRACSGVARATPCAVGARTRPVVVCGGGAGGGCVRGACGVQYGSSHRTEHGPTTNKTRISMHALRRAKTHTGMRLGGVAHFDANKGPRSHRTASAPGLRRPAVPMLQARAPRPAMC